MSEHVFTYQTRLVLDDHQSAILAEYSGIAGKMERSLFAALQAGRPLNELKREFIRTFGVTARQFNAVRVGLDGKTASIKERRPELIIEVKSRIAKAEKVITKLAKKAAGSAKLHQKKRRLGNLQQRLGKMEADQSSGAVRLCFGSKRLFRAQFHLEANGFASLDEWRQAWRQARSQQFFVLGSGDESAGNQTCQASLDADGELSLHLRLPDGMAAHGKNLKLANVYFAYGQEQIIHALQSSRLVAAQTKTGKPIKKRTGTAMSYRFMQDDKGWRVFVFMKAEPMTPTTSLLAGAIGVDVNADHLAVSETDRFGNLVGVHRIPMLVYGKTSDQAKAILGDAANIVAQLANKVGKPVVMESLDFQKKKTLLEGSEADQARMLSSFAYNKARTSIEAACFRACVEVLTVNPAFTSVIGALHAQRKGISVHQGAALAIARRGLGLSEKPTRRKAIVPVRNGGHVTFDLPVRNRSKHVWSQWSAIRKRLKAAHKAHYRSGDNKKPPAPLSLLLQALGAHRSSTARGCSANRSQHCSENVTTEANKPPMVQTCS